MNVKTETKKTAIQNRSVFGLHYTVMGDSEDEARRASEERHLEALAVLRAAGFTDISDSRNYTT